MAWWHRSWMPPPGMLEKLRCESYCYYCFILLLLFLFPLLSLLPYRSNKKPARPANAGLVKGGWGREGENEEGKGGTQMQVGSEKELNCHYEATSNN